METLRDFTNRTGITYDPDKTYILFAEDLAQIKENFTLLNQLLSLSRVHGTSWLSQIKQGEIPAGVLDSAPTFEISGSDVADPDNTNRGGDVAIFGGINNTTNERGDVHLGSPTGSVGYSVSSYMSQKRFLPIDFIENEAIMCEGDSDVLQFKKLKDFQAFKNLGRFATTNIFPYISGRYYNNALSGATLGAVAGAANRFDAVPFYCSSDVEIDEFGAECIISVAGSNIKVAIYSSGDDGLPFQLLYGGTDLPTATTGYKSYNDTIILEGGKVYWFAIRFSSTQTVRGVPLGSTFSLGPTSPSGNTMFTILRKTLTYSTDWPSDNPFTFSHLVGNIQAFCFTFKVA